MDRPTARQVQEVLAQVILLGVLAASAYQCDITIFGAGIIWLLGAITIHFVFHLLEAVLEDKGPAFERTSGLGGNMGGWRISRSFTLLILTLAFGFFTTIFALNAFNNPDKDNLRCRTAQQAPPADDNATQPDTTKTIPAKLPAEQPNND